MKILKPGLKLVWLLHFSHTFFDKPVNTITLIIVDFCRMLKLYKLSRRYTLDIMHKTSQIEITRKTKTPRLSHHKNGEFKFVTKNQQKCKQTSKPACKPALMKTCFKFKFCSKIKIKNNDRRSH